MPRWELLGNPIENGRGASRQKGVDANSVSVARRPRVSYARGDKVALALGVLLTLYALGWFVRETVQGLNRDRAVVPAQVVAP
jgi:hypothetical protein